MTTELHCGRLPDLPIALVGGGTINVADFCGQKLILFFCPADDPEASAREICAYRASAADFERAGAWVIGVGGPATETGADTANIHLAEDPDNSVFRALASFVPATLEIEADRGATFLVDRDGGIRAAWPGCGHVAQALEVARERP
jgi:peroxiredoxin